jgi:transposase
VSDKTPPSKPRYLPIDRQQFFLEPLDVDRLIDEDHAARKIWCVVEQLDLSRFASEVRAVEGVADRPSHSPQVCRPSFSLDNHFLINNVLQG